MGKLWLRNNKLVVDSVKRPILCASCPCPPAAPSSSVTQPPDTTCLQNLATQEGRVSAWPLKLYLTGPNPGEGPYELDWVEANGAWEFFGVATLGGCSGNAYLNVVCGGSYLLNLGDYDGPSAPPDPHLDINSGTFGPVGTPVYDPINLDFSKGLVTRNPTVTCSTGTIILNVYE